MTDIKVSIFGTWARPKDWPGFFESVSSNSISYEIVIAGPNRPLYTLPPNVRFIHVTPDPGPAPCGQIAANHCRGETIMLAADDTRYSPHALDYAYLTYKKENDYRCMVHFRWGTSVENDLTDKNLHLFLTPNPNFRYGFTLWSKQFFKELGGYDKKFTAGPGDADIQLRAYARGGRYVYSYSSFVIEDTTLVPGGWYQGAYFQRDGYGQIQNLLWKRWYEGEPPNITLRSEPTTPFEPFENLGEYNV